MLSQSVTSVLNNSKCFRNLFSLLNERKSCIRVCGLTVNLLSHSSSSAQNRKHFVSNLSCATKICWFESHTKQYHTTTNNHGRYGHRLVKLWEQKEYTTEPLKVFRTGGRLPNENSKGEIVPGKVWTAKLGGGLPRKFFWVERNRLTAEDVFNEVVYQEKVIKIKEDDNRSGFIALVAGPWKRRWVLCTENMKVGSLITNSGRPLEVGKMMNDGDAYPLKHIPNGTKVCFVEFRPGKGGQIARSAGSYCTLTRKSETRAVLTMPSKREIHVDLDCVAVIGVVSNLEHNKDHILTLQRRFELGMRCRTGRHHKKDGRLSSHANYASHPPIIIKEQKLLEKGTDFENI